MVEFKDDDHLFAEDEQVLRSSGKAQASVARAVGACLFVGVICTTCFALGKTGVEAGRAQVPGNGALEKVQDVCPGSPALIHARCSLTVSFDQSCDEVRRVIAVRVAAVHDCKSKPGTYSGDASSGARTTGDGKYTDRFSMSYVPAGSGCTLHACSESQVTSVIDFSTNYCNLVNLYGPNGTSPLTYTEKMTNCNQHDKSSAAGECARACAVSRILRTHVSGVARCHDLVGRLILASAYLPTNSRAAVPVAGCLGAGCGALASRLQIMSGLTCFDVVVRSWFLIRTHAEPRQWGAAPVLQGDAHARSAWQTTFARQGGSASSLRTSSLRGGHDALRQRLGIPRMQRLISTLKLRWAGHVARAWTPRRRYESGPASSTLKLES
eukprot:CAMPEP_0185164784 /NCGR_PEP_ID=MMETSP1139-20130426/9913_1 /TAXON_ID=298111 /ORGANISM="Pavlova sp., Strain CCMP459" /LENGTH=381 /DNA_ID=CAMNT_0027730169 /DNA_START=9 /DNA_END=1157 /DNA_ORIENTATION=+